MRPHPFTVDISDLQRTGSARPVVLEAPVDWGIEFGRVDREVPVRADLNLRSVPGGLVVDGTIDAVVELVCSACLEPFREEVTVPVAVTYERDLDETDHDGYALEGTVVDLEQMLRDELLTSLPLVPRCGRDHEGVVVSGGTDLNTGLSEVAPESPFAALRDLIDDDRS